MNTISLRWQHNKAFYMAVLLATLLMLVFAVVDIFFQDAARLALRYDRALIEQGQWWRLVTCHLVHLNLNHALLNLSGFLLCSFFFDDLLRFRHLCLWFVLSAPVVGVAFYLLDSTLSWYVGLSGILHGYFIVCLLMGIPAQPKLHLFVLALITGRLVLEQMPDYDVNYMQDYISGSVYVNAHLFGAIVGALLGGIFVWQMINSSPENEAQAITKTIKKAESE